MAGHDTAAQLRNLLAPAVEGAGLVLADVTVRAGRERTVTVVVDSPGETLDSPDLDTVTAVTGAVSDALDAGDAVLGDAPYVLEVTTPGAERVLAGPRDLARALTRRVALDLVGGTSLEGRLLEAGDELELEINEKGRIRRRRVPAADVVRGQVAVDFRRRAEKED